MKQVTNKDLRLALDLVEFFYPLYKNADKRSKAILVKDIFKIDTSIDDLEKVPDFKKILFKDVIDGINESANGKIKVKVTRVKRNHR